MTNRYDIRKKLAQQIKLSVQITSLNKKKGGMNSINVKNGKKKINGSKENERRK